MRIDPRTLARVMAAGLTAACASAPPPEISLQASERYVEKLAGRWNGSYWSADTGRHGSIRFDLELTSGIAHGEILMIPANERHLSPANEYEPHEMPPSPTPLHIEIIRAADNQVTGTLEPYRDPECDCLLSTSFLGTIRGDVIEGEFVSLGGPGHLKQTGSWKVERQPDS